MLLGTQSDLYEKKIIKESIEFSKLELIFPVYTNCIKLIFNSNQFLNELEN